MHTIYMYMYMCIQNNFHGYKTLVFINTKIYTYASTFCYWYSHICMQFSCLGTTTDSYQNTIQSYAYLFFVIPTIALLACLVFVGLCAVVIVLYSKEKFGHRRQVVTNTVDSIAMSTISHHVGRSEQSESPSYVCIHGGDTTKLHCPVVDPPPSYNQTVFSSSPPPPYSSKI